MSKAMTNGELAAYFSTLPPNYGAEVLIINGDTETVESEYLRFTIKEDWVGYDGAEEVEIETSPHIYQKW